MKILAISLLHDASLTILEDGKLIHYKMDERVSRVKHNTSSVHLMKDLLQYSNYYFDYIILLGFCSASSISNQNHLISFIQKNLMYKDIIITYSNHHLFHAYGAFHNASFNDAICLVVDGRGSCIVENHKNLSTYPERESLFYFSQDSNKLILKNYYNDNYLWNRKDFDDFLINYHPQKYNSNTDKECQIYKHINFYYNDSIGIGNIYELASLLIFPKTNFQDGSGKVMALSQYRYHQDKLTLPYNTENYKKKVKLANITQKVFQNRMVELIQYAIEKTGNKNVVLTGGCALNCVANYFFLEKFPDVNFYADPICFDAGQSLGAAYYYYDLLKENK